MSEKADETKSETTKDEPSKEDKEKGSEEQDIKLSREEVNKLIENARKQEKDKLYGKIEELTTTVKSLSTKAEQEQEAKEKAEKEAKQEAEKQRMDKLSNEERTAEILKKLEQQLQDTRKQQEEDRKAREDLAQRLEDERKQSELKDYRADAIRKASSDGLIEELVNGNTRDEVDNAIKLAKDKYKEIFQKAVTSSGIDKGRTGFPGPSLPDAALDEVYQGAGLTQDMIRNAKEGKLSEDYVKNRDKIKDQVADLYRRSMAR